MVPRYPGSQPMGAPGTWRDFDQLTLVLGAVTGDNAAAKTQTVEGRVYTVTYHNPDGRSLLEIYRNYEQGLLKAGFQTLYTCAGEPCGAWANVGGVSQTGVDDIDLWMGGLAENTNLFGGL